MLIWFPMFKLELRGEISRRMVFLAPIFAVFLWFRMTFGAFLETKIHPKYSLAARNCNWSSLGSPKAFVRITSASFWSARLRFGLSKCSHKAPFWWTCVGCVCEKREGTCNQNKNHNISSSSDYVCKHFWLWHPFFQIFGDFFALPMLKEINF